MTNPFRFPEGRSLMARATLSVFRNEILII
jgi:hypothetical protein